MSILADSRFAAGIALIVSVGWSSTVTAYWPNAISVSNTVFVLRPVVASSVALAEFRSCTLPDPGLKRDAKGSHDRLPLSRRS